MKEVREICVCIRCKKEKKMEPKDFIVVEIEGEYAYLREVGAAPGNERFIAMALLPDGVDIGTKLHYELLTYTLAE